MRTVPPGKTSTVSRTGVREKAERAARSEPMAGLARAGLAARGLLYVVVGLLAGRIAMGDREEKADKQGALELVARQPLGKVLLLAVAIGLAGYAVWRLAQAVAGGADDGESEGKAWAKRVGYLARGGFYAFLSVTAVRVVLGAESGSGSEEERDATARVLDWPLGAVLVAAAGVAFLGASAWQGWRAAKGKYHKDLEEGRMEENERRTAIVAAVAGLLTRMVMFGLIGLFLLKASWEHRANAGVGLDGALHRIVRAPAGPWILGVLAVGLLAFGLFSLFQARYRRVAER